MGRRSKRMKVKDIIKQSEINWKKFRDSSPALKTQGQTEFTWENYNKLGEKAIAYDNQEVVSVSQLESSEQDYTINNALDDIDYGRRVARHEKFVKSKETVSEELL